MTAQTTTVRTGDEVTSADPESSTGPQVCGAFGVASGVLFGAMVVWEHGAGLETGSGVPGAINTGGFLLAMTGYVVLAVGLALARPGGSGRLSRFFPALLAGAWTALIAGSLLEQFTSLDPESNLLNPLGGLAQGIGLLGLGISVVAARQWTGWRRFAPLAFAAYYVGALFVPAIAGVEPGTIAEVGWALGYSMLGLALMTAGATGHRLVAVATGVLSAGLLIIAVLVTTKAATVSPHRAEPANVPIVEDGRWGGPDVFEPRVVQDGRWGGPDVFEPRVVQDGRWGGPDVYEPRDDS
jgi:hypothetical protein